MSKHYPAINEKNIKLIKTLYSNDPKYFDDPSCPYSTEIIDLFKVSDIKNDFDPKMMDTDVDEITDFDEDSMLEQIQALWQQLQQFGRNVEAMETAAEKNTYFRLSVNLLDRVISMRERIMNVKLVSQFTFEVLQIMEEELDPDTRTRVMGRLKSLLET